MPSPLHEAGYLRPPKASGSREEVLARCFEAIANNDYQTPSMEARIQERFEKDVWYDNLEASKFPQFVPVGPMRPTREDERFKLYRARYGMISNN
ncbi:TPA: hypothetical protein OMU28_003026 [Klebsiella aerogenes]|nr:hypothetical protein [Klebsiella aerogenes]